ncbi:hypothetical protein J2Y55_002114 [Bosea sp. BE125]|uniref:hypothetical protein n=1 Tax=Bosea sp. BE125 TaxID=2817909 RepID=UPI002865E005|nr:hypothetical protein [Bosea sp. BE125]MDR6871106.1 hypothetical protein [Bosea sp. BE125]
MSEANWREIKKVAESSDLNSNSLFDILADWNHQLKHSGIDFDSLPNSAVTPAKPAAPAPITSLPAIAARKTRKRVLRPRASPLTPN